MFYCSFKALKSLQEIGKLQGKNEGKADQEKRTQSRKFEVIDRSASFKGKTYLLVDYIEGTGCQITIYSLK